MDKDPSWGNAMLHKELAVFFGNAFYVCAVRTTIPQAPGDAIAMAATISEEETVLYLLIYL